MDKHGSILAMNSTLREWLGYNAEEEVDAHSIEDLFSVGGKIYFQTHVLPLLQMQGNVSEINITFTGKNAVTFPALINAKKDASKPGKEQTYSVFALDITQRKIYENELLIERKKAEETADRLRQINNNLEQFAHTASHDLQAPLRTISGMIYLLEKKNYIDPDSEAEELFSLIKRNAEQMALMVKGLLEYSRVGSGMSDLKTVSVNKICRKTMEMLSDDIEKTGAEFHISDLPDIQGSEPQLVRLFQNLFENAMKYRSDAEPVIEITMNETQDSYHLRVKDNGVGFEDDKTDEIFSFMNRLHTDKNIPGSGIGLTTCKRIMENHGGTITAESEPGKGSVFVLEFPKKG